jgi:hypothetical protein
MNILFFILFIFLYSYFLIIFLLFSLGLFFLSLSFSFSPFFFSSFSSLSSISLRERAIAPTTPRGASRAAASSLPFPPTSSSLPQAHPLSLFFFSPLFLFLFFFSFLFILSISQGTNYISNNPSRRLTRSGEFPSIPTNLILTSSGSPSLSFSLFFLFTPYSFSSFSSLSYLFSI